ncbi:MAG: flagellar assembly protein FliX [Bosea sp. (in: a-proteobacteria)]
MRVDGRQPIQPNAQPAQRTGVSGQGFSLPTTTKPESNQKSGGVRSAMSSIPLDTMLAVQAREDDKERRKRHSKRGREMIDGLDRLKAALLSGRVPLGELERLKGMLSERRDISGDPQLDEIIGHIELRVAVELAKLGR